MGFRVVLAVLLFIATVKAAKGEVAVWGEYVTMTCPEQGDWLIVGNDTSIANNQAKYEIKYDGSKAVYYCRYPSDEISGTKYYFYVQGKVCSTCFEVDAFLFMVVIIIDLLATVGVMMIVYSCAKKKSSAGPTHASKQPARSGGRGPPVPSPDYEQLNTHTRSQDTYSIVNRTG